MTQTEMFKQMIAKYFEQDERTLEEKKEYDKFNPESSVELVRKLPAIQKKLGCTFPDLYVNFLQAGGLSSYLNDRGYDLFIYNEQDLYEFNYTTHHHGESAFEEMEGYLLFGQDGGECSYFFDPTNILGYGADAVYRIDRAVLERKAFELLAKDFKEFFSIFVENKELPHTRPFYVKPEEPPKGEGEAVVQRIQQDAQRNPAGYKKLQADMKQIKSYLAFIDSKCTDIDSDYSYECGYNMSDKDFYIVNKLEAHFNRVLPIEYLYLLNTLRGGFYQSPNIFFHFNNDLELTIYNLDPKANKQIKDMLVFGYVPSHLRLSSDNVFDFVFLDMNNRLGNGPSAIYMLPDKAKKLSEASYIAKDFVDLFRLIAENEQLNTKPVGVNK
jgi:hypothetical protein